MTDVTFTMPTANDRWRELIRAVRTYGKVAHPRSFQTYEVLAVHTRVPMQQPIVTVPSRKLGYRFLAAEAWWILSGTNRVDLIEPFSKQIANFSDDGYTFFGAYGPPVVDQLGYVVDALVKDPNTRQSVLTIWRPRPGDTRDVPCTISLQFMIRNGQLVTFANMRSSDVWLGVPYDWFNFSMISLFVAAMYMKREGTTLSLGDLHFYAASQHIYENNFNASATCMDDTDQKFEYDPIEPTEFADDPYRLIDHLYAVAKGRPQDLKSSMLRGLANDLKKEDAGVRSGRSPDRQQEVGPGGILPGRT